MTDRRIEQNLAPADAQDLARARAGIVWIGENPNHQSLHQTQAGSPIQTTPAQRWRLPAPGRHAGSVIVGDVIGGLILVVVGLAFSALAIYGLRSGEVDRISREQFEWLKPLFVIQTYGERRARILPIIFILVSLGFVVAGSLMVIVGL